MRSTSSRWKLVAIITMMVVLLNTAAGQLHSNTTLKFTNPANLSALYPRGVYLTSSTFGQPPYNAMMTGTIVYGTPDNHEGCTSYNVSSSPEWMALRASGTNVIVLIDRGARTCNFVLKVLHAQEAGAVAAIMTDSDGGGMWIPIMGDDGGGGAITIPSVMIRNIDGNVIKAHIQAHFPVSVSLVWWMPNPDDHVEWEYWTSSVDSLSRNFKSTFAPIVAALGDRASFNPHYFTSDPSSVCLNKTPPIPCAPFCTNNNRYCSPDPDGDFARGVNGSQVIVENLRQMCLYDFLNSTGHDFLWWEYVNRFNQNCSSTFAIDCSDRILIDMGLREQLPLQSVVSNCVVSSGGTTADAPNTRIEQERGKQLEEGVGFFPYVIINNNFFAGSLDCITRPFSFSRCNILQTICAGYEKNPVRPPPPLCQTVPGCDLGVTFKDACQVCNGTGPDICGNCLDKSAPGYNKSCLGCDGIPHSGKFRDACGTCGGLATTRDECSALSSSHGMSGGAVAGIVIAAVAVVGFLVFFYMRYQQRKMREDIDNLLHQYLPLDRQQQGQRGGNDKSKLVASPEETASDAPATVPSADI